MSPISKRRVELEARRRTGATHRAEGPDGSAAGACVAADRLASVLRLGAAVSVVQSILFVVIGVAALALGVERLVQDGFAGLNSADPAAFRVLCAAFILIAVLGLAITPAERALVEPADAGWAGLGARLAYLGHAGTIAFFSWWLLNGVEDTRPGRDLDAIAPIVWGVMFELVFVGAWVWIIAGIAWSRLSWPRGFLWLSVAKATSFWLAFGAFVINDKWMLLLGLGAVTFVTGPAWHLWISRLFLDTARRRGRG